MARCIIRSGSWTSTGIPTTATGMRMPIRSRIHTSGMLATRSSPANIFFLPTLPRKFCLSNPFSSRRSFCLNFGFLFQSKYIVYSGRIYFPIKFVEKIWFHLFFQLPRLVIIFFYQRRCKQFFLKPPIIPKISCLFLIQARTLRFVQYCGEFVSSFCKLFLPILLLAKI